MSNISLTEDEFRERLGQRAEYLKLALSYKYANFRIPVDLCEVDPAKFKEEIIESFSDIASECILSVIELVYKDDL